MRTICVPCACHMRAKCLSYVPNAYHAYRKSFIVQFLLTTALRFPRYRCQEWPPSPPASHSRLLPFTHSIMMMPDLMPDQLEWLRPQPEASAQTLVMCAFYQPLFLCNPGRSCRPGFTLAGGGLGVLLTAGGPLLHCSPGQRAGRSPRPPSGRGARGSLIAGGVIPPSAGQWAARRQLGARCWQALP